MFYSVLFVYSYLCCVEVSTCPFYCGPRVTQKKKNHFMNLLWIINFSCICIFVHSQMYSTNHAKSEQTGHKLTETCKLEPLQFNLPTDESLPTFDWVCDWRCSDLETWSGHWKSEVVWMGTAQWVWPPFRLCHAYSKCLRKLQQFFSGRATGWAAHRSTVINGLTFLHANQQN